MLTFPCSWKEAAWRGVHRVSGFCLLTSEDKQKFALNNNKQKLIEVKEDYSKGIYTNLYFDHTVLHYTF